MSVQRLHGDILFKCHRASCGVRGRTGTNGHAAVTTAPTFQPQRIAPEEPLSKRVSQLPMLDSEILHEQLGMAKGRVLFPVTSHTGALLGHVARRYSWLSNVAGPKSLNYIESNEYPWLHFPYACRMNLADEVVLVEDCLSAIVVSRLRPCVSMMGTHLTMEAVQYLLDIGITKVRIALDADATAQAVKLRDKWDLYFAECSVIILQKDAKDMNGDELQEVFTC